MASKKVNTNNLDAFGGDGITKNGNIKATMDDAFATANAFDAFAMNAKTTAITKSSKVFDDFNDNGFEDDFFNKSSNEQNQKLKKIQNNTTLSKTQNSDLSSKFEADYSNPDSFDNDLEEAIKRSMLEK